jgi:CheY-like chemotaxis protein
MSEPYRLLLVDDDQDTCELMSLMLQMANDNYQVIAANNAAEALKMLQKKPFDIYILDSLLPDMSGFELCAKIRQTNKQIPILFYSGRAENHYINKAKAAGATEYLVKPNDLERFTEVISRHLK